MVKQRNKAKYSLRGEGKYLLSHTGKNPSAEEEKKNPHHNCEIEVGKKTKQNPNQRGLFRISVISLH